jgi:hypothetical protein
MTREITRKISHSMAARTARQSAIPARRARGVDITLGVELMSDRHVAPIWKLRALGLGGAVVAMLLGAVALVAHAYGLQGTGIDPVSAGIVLLSGSAVFGVLLMPRTVPNREVSRLQCKHYAVIPLKARKPVKETGGNPERFFGGAPAPKYAVIPRRQR